MKHVTSTVSASLLLIAALGLVACTVDEATPVPAPAEDGGTAPSSAPEQDEGEEGYNKPGAVMLLESQFGPFGGTAHWEGDTLVLAFDGDLDESIEAALVCGVMNGLVQAEHTTRIELPSGSTECSA